MKLISFFLIFPIILGAYSKEYAPWQKRHAEGWAWYHDLEEEKTTKKEEAPKDPIAILSTSKQELERALAKAMLEPSKENVLAYMILQKKWTDQSNTFAQLWQLNILEHPEIASKTPTTQYGVQVKKEAEANDRKKIISDISKNHILLFFYEGASPFSQAFSKAVKMFSKQYNWIVKPIAIDGIILKDFPKSIADPSIAQEMDVNIFPALFIADSKTLTATPISFGMLTISQIEENILIQFKEKS